ncbi:MAG: TIGR03032 family protein [Gemmataceae bacterium]
MADAPQPAPPESIGADLRSVHTTSLPALLDQLGVSVAVTTYQAGKFILVRAEDGKANTHFRGVQQPMGLARRGNRLALGTATSVREYVDQPALATKLPPTGRHDACYVPRSSHVTGDIAIHELAFVDRELWIVNTRFSCLCTLDSDSSFVPRWRPPFITGLSLEDRCHLNGLGVRDGQVRYVTALGATDTAAGWRANKRDGGILMDVPSGAVIARGLSMPHSPRWYADRLWVLESGTGTLAVVDESNGRLDVVARMPGFTRGLDFWGPYAFIGLSQVRETAVFSGIPIAERPIEERACGVWVIDVRTGQTIAFLRFEAGVQEIFAVLALPNRYPDLLADESDEHVAHSYILPDEALPDVRPAPGPDTLNT